ncbi:hypothetical protein [Cellvibrio mixtus]|uniref:hypothetical protein n=1 Tax=Cellvibrio mixtus TaxID=39650 RepID=UPI0005868CF4|nr:hypothetical protein [Cellvibrio mixtus]
MVTSLLRALRFFLAVLSQAVLLLYAGAAYSSSVNLAPGLEIDLPSALSLDVITAEDQPEPANKRKGTTIGSPIIAGKINGEPAYFIAASKVKNWEKNSILWKRLENGISDRSKPGEFLIRQRGNFTTLTNEVVWFRVYEFEADNQKHRQVYFLLNQQRTSYWITLTMVKDGDINLAIPIAKALLSRARVIE